MNEFEDGDFETALRDELYSEPKTKAENLEVKIDKQQHKFGAQVKNSQEGSKEQNKEGRGFFYTLAEKADEGMDFLHESVFLPMKPFLSAHLSTPWFHVLRVFKPVYELGDVVYSKFEYQIIERFPRLYYGVPSLAAVNGRLFGECCLDIRPSVQFTNFCLTAFFSLLIYAVIWPWLFTSPTNLGVPLSAGGWLSEGHKMENKAYSSAELEKISLEKKLVDLGVSSLMGREKL
eukprot:CAMPEP_0198223758 /NCGR_PEP_ID=MMETSP1445-20131203/93840_1 /TAXON_ID=36898 /ORGANISM="Pyramimonas sp., Strain CCMP2087" /LENGTH=232 /DNA_ID=CAMNT_0043902697 /DNA_START=221 /DNA_END=915 /DNA_ORIENTATION=+